MIYTIEILKLPTNTTSSHQKKTELDSKKAMIDTGREK